MALKKVAILGIRGRLGPFLLKALVHSNKFEVTVLQRAGSSGTLPEEYADKVRVVELPPDFLTRQGDVVKKLAGLDALVMSIPGGQTKEHYFLANCAIKAGVKRFVPADFGSVDSSDRVCIDTVPLYEQKKNTRETLRGLSMMYSHVGFSWTSLVCGHFFDYGIEVPLLGFDISTDPPKATIFDNGDKKWSASTRAQIGRALVAVLEKYEESKNKMLYIQSFCTNQNEVLETLERVGGRKFEITKVGSEDYIKQKQEEIEKEIGHDPVEELIGVLGLTRADWTQKTDFANDLLGLKEEILEEEVRKVLSAAGFLSD